MKLLKQELECLHDLSPKVWKKNNFKSSATCTSFRLRENHFVFLEISELAFKIVDLFMAFYRVYF